MQAGACFGMSAASCRMGFMLARAQTWAAAPAGVLVGVGFTSLGFVLQTVGLKDGNTVVVCTCAAVSSIATGAHAASRARVCAVAHHLSRCSVTRMSSL